MKQFASRRCRAGHRHRCASAADLAARPYTKRPRWSPRPMTGAGSTPVSTAAGVRAATPSARLRRSGSVPKVRMMRTAARSVARSATAGRPARSCSVEAQGNWADFSGSNSSLLFGPGFRQQHEDRCLRPVHRPDRLRRQQRPALRQGRCRCDLEQLQHQLRSGRRAVRCRWRRHPLGCLDRCRPRIRLLAELVGWRRVQPPVHAGPYL